MQSYAELLQFNQPSPVRKEGFTKIRDAYPGLSEYKGKGVQRVDAFLQDYQDPERIVEFAGRSDYGVKNAKKLGSDDTIIQRWIDSGHHSMLEFASATFYIECSRVVSHELVRHRLANFQQESQRYVKYEGNDPDELFYMPEQLEDGDLEPELREAYAAAFSVYTRLRDKGLQAQLARYVLPNSTATRLVMNANLREWRHIVNLRTAKAAQPEMQKLMWQIHDQLVDIFPNIMYNATAEKAVR
jgi:thymidylate synthase (FAD)